MTEKQNKIVAEIGKLEAFYGTKLFKYRDNLKVYTNRWNIELNDLRDDYATVMYEKQFGEGDNSAPITENVVKSVVETLVSKIAAKHCYPFLNTVNGTFKDLQICKQTQQFFDIYFKENDIVSIVAEAFRDACIFNTGVIYVNPYNNTVKRVMPWQIFIDPREYSYDDISKLVYKRNHYPTELLNLEIDDDRDEVTFYEYYKATKNGLIKYEWIPELQYFKENKCEFDVIPFTFIFYDTPVKGSNGNSVCDVLRGIQIEINRVVAKIKEACDLTPGNLFMVPDTSTIRTSQLTNRGGQIVTYTPTGEGSPVVVATPAFIDPQNIQWLSTLKQDAYELIGVSQLSATSQKPTGLNSGISLQTMEDIESDRFQTQLNNVIRMYTNIAKLIIATHPTDDTILPPNFFRNNITWADVVDLSKNMSVEFSTLGLQNLDPSAKLTTIQNLVNAGYITQQRAGILLQIPDLEMGYSFANNALNAVLAVIDNCIYNDSYDIPDFINIQLLQEELINTLNSLYSNSNNYEVITKLQQLFKTADEMLIESETQAELGAVNAIGQQVQSQLPQIQQQAMKGANAQIDAVLGGGEDVI